MFTMIGDYIHLGDTVQDPIHSTLVCRNTKCAISINRVSKRLHIHIWLVDDKYEVTPLLSTGYEALKKEFLK